MRGIFLIFTYFQVARSLQSEKPAENAEAALGTQNAVTKDLRLLQVAELAMKVVEVQLYGALMLKKAQLKIALLDAALLHEGTKTMKKLDAAIEFRMKTVKEAGIEADRRKTEVTQLAFKLEGYQTYKDL